MSDNPWLPLPAQPPFVLPEDEQAVHEFNAEASEDHRLQIADFLPEPFIGDPASPVLLLSNNPGFSKHSAYRKQPEFMTKIRDCISLKMANCPFFYLAPDHHSRWWRQKLKCLLQKFGDDLVARSVCNVVFFPYVSKKFGHGHCKLPSQEFSFRLVREAVERGAVIVLMRKGQLKHWTNNVPRLGDYDKLILLRNPRMPAVSPKNCDAGDYEKIVAAIAAAEMKRPKATTDGLALSTSELVRSAEGLRVRIAEDTLVAIQRHFHAVIRGRAAKLIDQHGVVLPELAPLLTAVEPKAWFPVPGMYGGFSYWLEGDGPDAKLVTESWCRVVGGSGQRHEVTAAGSQLVEEGFV